MENVIRVYAKLMKNEKGTYYNCSTVFLKQLMIT